MAAPAILDYEGGPAATSDRIAGPFIAALAGVAVGECTRSVRWWLLPFAVWLIVAPLTVDMTTPAAWNSVACGVAVAALSLVRGRVKTRFGGGWIALFRPQRLAHEARGG